MNWKPGENRCPVLVASVDIVFFFQFVEPAEVAQDRLRAVQPLRLLAIVDDVVHGVNFRLVRQKLH